jgi:hypothetical protein
VPLGPPPHRAEAVAELGPFDIEPVPVVPDDERLCGRCVFGYALARPWQSLTGTESRLSSLARAAPPVRARSCHRVEARRRPFASDGGRFSC